MSQTLLLPAKTAALSDSERGLLAWVKLNFAESVWQEIERLLTKEQALFKTTSMVDEHRIRQEASKRNVRLPR